MNTIKIRKSTINDLPTLLSFEQKLIEAERPFDKTLKAGFISYYDIKEMILNESIELLVAEKDNELIGSGYARIETAQPFLAHKKYAYLGFMFVLESERGQGLNKRIFNALMDWLKIKEINEVRLDVYNENASAVKAYEKVGFKKHLINMRLDL